MEPATTPSAEPAAAARVAPSPLPRPLERIAGDFPVLAREVGGHPVCYLDSSATAQTPAAVIEAMDSYYRLHNANIHRGVYTLAEEATELYEDARRRVAAWVGAEFEEIVFVRNATEAINLVAYAWGRANVEPGDLIVTTLMEHHSNIVPWQILARERGAALEYVALTAEGKLDPGSLAGLLARGPRLVVVAHVSNVLGTINPVAEIAREARAAGATVLVDGAQAVPQLPVDVKGVGADFYAFTGHKMYGPTGIGVLWGRRELLEAMPPFIAGGHMIRTVERLESSWNDLPWKFEAGTSPIAEAVGLGAAVDWLAGIGMEPLRAHELELTGYALERLAEVPGLRAFGPPAAEDRGALVSFATEGIHPHDVAQILDRSGVCIRAGHHCAMPLMRQLGVAATSRASFAVHNGRQDVDRLIDGLHEARRVFQL